MDEPEGHAALDRRRLPALAVVGPRQRAAAQRALPRLPRVGPDARAACRSASRSSRYTTALYALGSATGYYAPPGLDPDADLTTWNAKIQAGEPYGADARAIADEIHDHHQGYGLPGTPAPLLLLGGWTDDLFPPAETLRVYNALRAANPAARVSLQLGDLGHARGSNKANADHAFNDAGSAFFDAYLRGAGSPPAPGSVTAFTQTCPQARGRRRPVRRRELARAAPRRRAVRRGRRADRRAPAAATRRPRRPTTRSAAAATPAAARRRRPRRAPPTTTPPRRPATRCSAARRSAPRSPPAAPTASSPRGCGTSRRAARRCSSRRGIYRLLDNQSGTHHVPAQRQRLPLREGPRAAARAARPRRAVLPRQQRLVQRRGLEAPGRAAGRRAPRLRARRRLAARRAAAARPQAPAAHAHGPLRAQAPHAARARAPRSARRASRSAAAAAAA